MKTFRCQLKGVSPYSPSKPHQTEKLDKESADAFEKRTWREKAHYDKKTMEVYIPPMSFKKSIEECAQYLGIKIPGRGNATWSKHFLAGVIVTEPLMLGVDRDSLDHDWVYCNADGKKGSGTRVMRCFPIVREWGGVVEFTVLDDEITEAVFKHHLVEAGKFIGIGRWRPRQGGLNGRFEVVSVKEV